MPPPPDLFILTMLWIPNTSMRPPQYLSKSNPPKNALYKEHFHGSAQLSADYQTRAHICLHAYSSSLDELSDVDLVLVDPDPEVELVDVEAEDVDVPLSDLLDETSMAAAVVGHRLARRG